MTGWVDGVVEKLGDELGGTVVVVAGERDKAWRDDRDLVCVWWPGWDELSRDTALAQPQLTLRYFPKRSVQPADQTPVDPSPLTDAADVLLGYFTRATEGVGFFTSGLACRLTSLRPSYAKDVWRVEGTLVAYTLRPSA